MSTSEEIKARIDIVDLVSETVKLRRTGKNYTGFCPFHPNSRTPAFVVFPDSGTWRCFGQCNEGGDIFRFVMKKEGWDFPQALRFLADKAGIQLEVQTPEKQAEEEQYARLRGLMEDAVTFFRYHLLQTPAGKNALDYLVEKRGLTMQTLEAFGLGYAPDAWDAALKYFTAKDYTPQELLEVGLVTEAQESSRVYDRFRHRITFPIRDMVGRMCGFGARILRPDDIPKFLNSPQTVLFDKGRLLYGLDLARKPIRAQDQAVIVEGYLDVIALHQAGFSNAVSPMGTALSEDQIRLLKRFTRRIVLALDPDAAGVKATLRGLETARQAMDHSDELVFDARGLVRHEARLQADVRVTTLPEGMDPDDVVLRDAEEWAKIVANAQPVVIHVMETLALGRDLDDPKTKSEIAAQVLPLIEDVPNAIERDSYRQRLARLLRVDERALVGAAAPAPRTGRRAPRIPRSQKAQAPDLTLSQIQIARKLEAHTLRLLLRQPDAVDMLDRALQSAELSRLGVTDFEYAEHQILGKLILESLDQDEMEPAQYIQDHMPETVQDLAGELLTPMAEGEPVTDRLVEDLVHTVVRLRLLRVSDTLNQLRYMQEELQQQGDLTLGPYQESFFQYQQIRNRLDQALVQRLHFE
jgi:DNA primase